MVILAFPGPVLLLGRVGGPVELPPVMLFEPSDVLFNIGSASGLPLVPFAEVALAVSPPILPSRVTKALDPTAEP